MSDTVKYRLDESRIPTSWYNQIADLPSPPPPVLHPGTMKRNDDVGVVARHLELCDGLLADDRLGASPAVRLLGATAGIERGGERGLARSWARPRHAHVMARR